MASEIPSGTVTFLFTDIEGSTRMAQKHRASWESLRDRHHAILSAALEAHNGYLFEIVGDAFCVAFHRPADALLTALEMQRGLYAEPWEETPLRVRMGIHTGVAEPDGERYRGYMALSSVARVMSVAHGGQILLSQGTFDLVEDDVPEDVALRDMGEHRLKDLLRSQHLYQPVTADLPSEFPALKTLDAQPNNLPVQLTSFIGREGEIRDLTGRLEGARLITLTGIAGTGKTRLALQVAAEVVDHFKDGAWLVELAPLSDPAQVPQAISSALNLREQTGRPTMDVLKDYVSHSRTLLLLDNCEHLLEDCAAVAHALLQAGPQLSVLATSREALALSGELAYPVSPLSMPATDASSASAIAGFDAIRLFLERVAAAQPGFVLTDENAAFVSQIVSRLDGIPLALELAAARARGMTVEQIAGRLDDRFRLLAGGSRAAPARQRTLRATIDWSHELLSTEERTLFRRLAVFVGGWTAGAARAITSFGDLQEGDLDDLLSSLVEKSLVVLDAASNRFHMLETVRDYALEQLAASGEEQESRTRHLDYWVTCSQDPALDEYQDESAFGFLLPERQNLLAALQWCESAEEGAQKALLIMGGTRYYWWLAGEYASSYDLARRVVERPGAQTRNRARERGLQALAHTAIFSGKTNLVMGFLTESLSIAQDLEDDRGRAEAAHLLGIAEMSHGDLEQGVRYVKEGLVLARAAGVKLLVGMMLNTVGEHQRVAGNLEAAQAAYEEAAEYLGQTRSPNMSTIALLNLASVATAHGDLWRARDGLLGALDLIGRSEFSSAPGAGLLDGTAGYLAASGAWLEAARLWGASAALMARVGGFRDLADRIHLDPLMLRAREALGDEAYAAAIKEGEKLNLAQALAEARTALNAADD